MSFRIAIAAVGALFLLAPPAFARSAALERAIAEYERLDKLADPITAGFDGDRAALSRLPDASLEAQTARRAALVTLKSQIERISARGLTEDESTNRALLLRMTNDAIEGIDFDRARMPIGNDSGFFSLGDYLARTTPIQSTADADAWIARLEALPLYYEQNIANMRRGIATGFTQPRIVVDIVANISRAQIATMPGVLEMPFAEMPESMPAATQESYRTRARAIIADRVMPAHRAFVAFMEGDYAHGARPQIAIRSTPNGAAYYEAMARYHTTTGLTPDEIHALGVSEVTRIRGQMDAIIREVGFRGTFAEFQNFLRTDPQFYATTPEDLLEKTSEIAKRADDQLPRFFATLPRLTYGVRPVPADIAEAYTSGRYWPGSPALGQAGGLMMNTSRLNQRGLYELPALTLHEGVPGHHLQIALAQELGDQPYFRRNAGFTAFVEGWGLYSESLGEDMGIYRTPYERFGRLSYEMWRACRLVSDTGIHWLGWDIEQARRCFAENSALSPHNIQTELERYISDPGQALAYKVGELRLQALRRDAQQALGDRFNIREFHDVVLGAGALPMDVLEARVRAWVAAQ